MKFLLSRSYSGGLKRPKLLQQRELDSMWCLGFFDTWPMKCTVDFKINDVWDFEMKL